MASGFQAFTIRANGILDHVVSDISVCPAYDPDQSPEDSNRTYHPTKALWDTGASKSALSAELVARLELTPVGAEKIHTAGGSRLSSTYMVNFELPNKVRIAGALVAELTLPGGFDCLVGMDVIALGDFSITNVSGHTVMSFRTPSIETIDYVEEWRRVQFAGVGRNAPCPCGKTQQDGKPVKFKRCHGS